MKKTVSIDVRPIIASLYSRYTGELNRKQWYKKERIEKQVIDMIKERLNGETFYHLHNATYSVEFENLIAEELRITFEWQETENINVWSNELILDYATINKVFSQKLIVYMSA